MEKRFYPTELNLGENCQYWDNTLGCYYPKAEMEGRRSCEGIIDDVCLYLKDKRMPKSLTEEQIIWLKTRIPHFQQNIDIPPGDIE